MPDRHGGMDPHIDIGFKELEIVAFIGDFKIVGFAHFGVGARSSSRRASDYIRAFNDTRITLSRVRIYNRGNQELAETAPFVILNLDKVDFLYAREEGSQGDVSAGQTGE